MEKEIKISVVDIWSTIYSTCLKGYLKQVGTIEGKPVYKSEMRGNLYMLTDSRYGSEYYI
jgi:hypothetical protein